MNQNAINDALWGFSLLLQCVLFARVLRRGLARSLPCFTFLLGFYPVRAAALFMLFGRVVPASYAAVHDDLSLAGLLLQLLVAAEIGRQLFKLSPGRARYGVWVIPFAAGIGTMVMWSALPVRSPVPPDRLQIFCSFNMVLLGGWSVANRAHPLLRNAATGLAVYGVVDLLATAGKTFAAVHRNAREFTGWSYASSGVYVCVVVFWIVAITLPPGILESKRLQHAMSL